jgi:hypothetical protein
MPGEARSNSGLGQAGAGGLCRYRLGGALAVLHVTVLKTQKVSCNIPVAGRLPHPLQPATLSARPSLGRARGGTGGAILCKTRKVLVGARWVICTMS